ncbi:MAG: DNA-3-methyladenine glycosylase [Candidatus Saccharimonadales bacterium]
MTFAEKLQSAQKHLSKNDRTLAKAIKTYGDCQLRPHKDHYGELVSGIVGQQLSIKAAAAIWQRVLALSDGKMPTPQQLLKTDVETLRSIGLSYAKASYVQDLALHIIDGRLDMDHIAKLPNEEIMSQLTAVKGIGEWSAHMFMLFGLGRLDILPVGDLGIKKAAMNLYGLKELPDRIALEALSSRNSWKPYESVAAWYLWKSLENNGIRIKKD